MLFVCCCLRCVRRRRMEVMQVPLKSDVRVNMCVRFVSEVFEYGIANIHWHLVLRTMPSVQHGREHEQAHADG